LIVISVLCQRGSLLPAGKISWTKSPQDIFDHVVLFPVPSIDKELCLVFWKPLVVNQGNPVTGGQFDDGKVERI